jgi:ankyrin repeat protein
MDINCVDNTGQNALFYAARDGRIDTVKYLVEHGINVNQLDKQKLSGLSWAKRTNHHNIVEYLLENGAIDH